MIEPIDHRRRRPLAADPSGTARRPRLEPMCGPDVIKIQQRAFIKFTRTCFDPLLLVGAPTGRIDPKTHSCAGCEIERVSCAGDREFGNATAVCP